MKVRRGDLVVAVIIFLWLIWTEYILKYLSYYKQFVGQSSALCFCAFKSPNAEMRLVGDLVWILFVCRSCFAALVVMTHKL